MSHFGNLTDVSIREAILTNPLVVTPTTLLSEAIPALSCHPTGCALVMGQQLVGIVTKTDVVRAIATGGSIEALTVAAVMSQPVHTACLDELANPSAGWQWLQKHQVSHLPVISAEGIVLGVITPRSLLKALEADHQQIQDNLQSQIQTLLEVQNRYEMMGMVGEQVLYEWDSQIDQIIWGGSTAVLGYSLAEMPLGLEEWTALIHPDEREAFKNEIDKNLRERTPFAMEYRLRRKNGEYLWVEDKFQLFVKGHEVREVGFIADITKRKQIELERERIEEALRQKNQEFQAIFEAFPDLLFRLHGDGTVLGYETCNLIELYARPETFLGGKLQDLLPHPAGLRSYEAIRETIETNAVVSYEYALPMPDGEHFYEARMVRLHADQVIAVVRDISDRKRIEATLRRSRAELQALFAAMTDIVIIFDRQGYYLAVATTNAQLLHGSAASLIGKSIEQVLAPHEAKVILETIEQALDTRQTVSIEYSLLDRQQQKNWFSAKVSPLSEHSVIWVTRDITDRKLVEDALRYREQEFRALAENSPDMIIRIDRAYRYVYVNPAVERETKQAAQAILGKTCDEFSLSESLAPRWRSVLQTVFREKQERAIDYTVMSAGEVKYYASRIVPEFASDGSVETILVVARDVTQHKNSEELLRQLYEQLQAANQELQRLALLDGLTHVGNRRCFNDHLQQEWNRLARERLPLSLILCDVDGFKRFNDLYGHLAGDQCLIQIAQSLSRTSRRPADLVARYGGEEFAIILPNTAQSGAITVAIAIQENIKELDIPHSDSPTGNRVTVSLGIATTIPYREASPRTLIEAADQALYQAKRQGRDRYCCFNLE